MFEIIILLLSIYGAISAPAATSLEFFDDVDNEAQIVEAFEPFQGTMNLHEKSIPVKRLKYPYIRFSGSNNLGERSQIPQDLPGVRNLEEKAIPESITARRSHLNEGEDTRNPKSEFESFAY